MNQENVVIIGSGPAGYTAAIYTARAGLEPVLFASSVEAGGDLMKTTDVENFPGFPKGIMGPDLMEEMKNQAIKFGCKMINDDVISVDLKEKVKQIVSSQNGTFLARAVILATGSEYRKLNIPGEKELSGYGVSYCATCDGAFFRDQDVAVAGGGDSAMEEAIFLTKFAKSVTIINRSNRFRASGIMLERARQNPKIKIITNAVVQSAHGDQNLQYLTLADTENGHISQLNVSGFFVAIGSSPRTAIFADQIDLNADGTVKLDGRSSRTSLQGVFACGDVADNTYRQAVTAAGSGCCAAIDAGHYLENL